MRGEGRGGEEKGGGGGEKSGNVKGWRAVVECERVMRAGAKDWKVVAWMQEVCQNGCRKWLLVTTRQQRSPNRRSPHERCNKTQKTATELSYLTSRNVSGKSTTIAPPKSSVCLKWISII